MSSFVKVILVLVLLLGVVLPMMIKGPDGKPIMSVDDWIPDVDTEQVTGAVDQLQALSSGQVAPDQAGTLPDPSPNNAPMVKDSDPAMLGSSSGKMYKWQDENGRWHFSSQKPAASEHAQVEDLPDMENVMDAPVNEEENSSMMGLPGLLLGQ